MKVIKLLLFSLFTILTIFPFLVSCYGLNNSENNAPKCSHDDKIICSNCGEILLGNNYYSNLLNSSIANDLQTKITGSITATLNKDNTTFIYEDDNGYYKKLVASNLIISVSGEIFTKFTDGYLVVDGSILVDIDMKDDSGKTLVKTPLTLDNFKIENDIISYKVTEKVLFPTLSITEKKVNEKTFTYENSKNISYLPYFKDFFIDNEKDKNLSVATILNDICTVTKESNNNLFTFKNLGTFMKTRLNTENESAEILNFLDNNASAKLIADSAGNIRLVKYSFNLDMDSLATLDLIENLNSVPENLQGQLTIKTTFTND